MSICRYAARHRKVDLTKGSRCTTWLYKCLNPQAPINGEIVSEKMCHKEGCKLFDDSGSWSCSFCGIRLSERENACRYCGKVKPKHD